MTPYDTALRQLIIRHEGWRLRRYFDTRGIPTIGAGYNLMQYSAPADLAAAGCPNVELLRTGVAVLTSHQAATLLTIALERALEAATTLDSAFNSRPQPAQRALVDMVYTLGSRGAAGFTVFWQALHSSNYAAAAAALEDSLWYKQATNRVTDCIHLLYPESTATPKEIPGYGTDQTLA